MAICVTKPYELARKDVILVDNVYPYFCSVYYWTWWFLFSLALSDFKEEICPGVYSKKQARVDRSIFQAPVALFLPLPFLPWRSIAPFLRILSASTINPGGRGCQAVSNEKDVADGAGERFHPYSLSQFVVEFKGLALHGMVCLPGSCWMAVEERRRVT